jgi:hypothetical protein
LFDAATLVQRDAGFAVSWPINVPGLLRETADVAGWLEARLATERERIAQMIEHDEISAAGEQPLNQCGLPAAIRALGATTQGEK